jgi:hypothetical protein
MSDGTSAPVTIAQGGTGANTRQAAMDALAGAVTSGRYLRGDGTDVIMDTLRAGDMTGTLAVANGGTGVTSPGTSGNVLTSNGTAWVSSTPPAVPESNNDQIFTSSGTFNVPAGVARVKVTVIGAGGNGGNGAGDFAGGGGGAGGYVVDYVAVTPGGTATVTVGTNAGTRTSSFAGGTTLTASGGSNGNNSDGGISAFQGSSGATTLFGQTGYVASTNISQSGIISYDFVPPANTRRSPVGVCYSHGYGAGGASINASTANSNGAGFGAGGAGGGTPNPGFQSTGATGRNGLVIVEW